MLISEVFAGIADTIAQLNPSEIIQMHAPEAVSLRVSDLVEKKKLGNISIDENAELERFLALDLFISLAKAKARMLLQK